MLSIGIAKGSYYTNLATKDDYFHKNVEPEGVWYGKGAKELGFDGTVEKEEFLKLCDGFGKDGEPLVQNAGRENHKSANDFCYSAPKSVSVLWSQADPETREKIQEAHLKAVKKSLDYLEEKGTIARRGHNGVEIEKGKLVIAIYEHGTSREQDPELHSHAVVANVCVRSDGTTGALETQKFYALQLTGGAIYRAELANQLQKELGVEIEKTKVAFEVKGVPQDLCREFSKRRIAIEEAMKEANAFGAERAEYFALKTRGKKELISRDELFEKWQEVGKAHSFDINQVLGRNERNFDKDLEKHLAVEKAVSEITYSQAYFSEQVLMRKTAEQGLGKLNADDVQSAVETYLKNEAVFLGEGYGRGRIREPYYTTQEIINLEKKMLSEVRELKEKPFLAKEGRAVAIKQELNAEQKKALLEITDNRSSISVVSGMAGTGKTTLLQTAKDIWEAEGFTIKGAALAGKAAQGLEEGAGIKSDTIHKTLAEIERGNIKLDNKTVLVVDEAGMVGTRQMSSLVNEVSKANAKLVLVGDERQLQPIEHGNPFKAIGERVGRSELQEIRRQQDFWARDAVKDFAFGDAEKGLKAYAERGLLTVSENRKEAMQELIKTWSNEKAENPKNSLILAGTRAEARELNRLCQADRINNNELREKTILINNVKIFENDRVLFTRNSRIYGVKNGDLGTVLEVSNVTKQIKVELDNKKYVTIPTQKYEEVQLGYAVTTHKAQGVTVDKSYILAGSIMQDRELSYVQVSRSRSQTKIFVEKAEVGDTVAELSKQMSKSRQKEIALSLKIDNGEITQQSIMQKR